MESSFFKAIVWITVLCFSLEALAEIQSSTALVNANTGFAVDFYKKICKESQGQNVFFSPISISTAFGMVHLGARDKTKAQLKAVLNLENINSDEEINEAFKHLLTSFKNQGNSYTLNLANRLFGSDAFQFSSEYLSHSESSFGASLEPLNFRQNPEESRLRINSWVADNTNQKIKDLLSTGTIDSNTILVIVNAIYFKAQWQLPFNKNNTGPDSFRISNSQTVEMDMMRHGGKYLNYYDAKDLGCEVLELNCKEDKASMFIFLPRDVEGLAGVEAKLTPENLQDAMAKVEARKVNVKFPKFFMDQSISLKKFLQSMGLRDLFDAQKSNLSGIAASGRLFAVDAVHKAYFNVDEHGLEAAAATAVIMGVSSILGQPIEFNVDRPFLFLIRETNTGSVLFLGRLVKPPKSNDYIGKFGEAAALRDTAHSVAPNFVFVCLALMSFACLFI